MTTIHVRHCLERVRRALDEAGRDLEPGEWKELLEELYAEESIITFLTLVKEMCLANGNSAGIEYAGVGDLLLRLGKWGVRPRLYRARRAVPRACFRNAAMAAADHCGWRYVEGYAAAKLSNSGILPIHHGWCVDRGGRTVETTWKTIGLAYFGIEFPLRRIIESGGSVLDDHRIYLEPWKDHS